MSNLIGSIEISIENDADHFTLFKLENDATGDYRYFHQGKDEDSRGFSPDVLIARIEDISKEGVTRLHSSDIVDEVKEVPETTKRKADAYHEALRAVDSRIDVIVDSLNANAKFTAYDAEDYDADATTNQHLTALYYAKEILEEAYEEVDYEGL